MNNLYNKFQCESKEELYMLVKENDERVEPLINYMDFSKGNIGNKNQAIKSSEELTRYMASLELPSQNKVTILFTNTKNQPLLLERVNIKDKDNIIDTIKKGIIAGSSTTFLGVDDFSLDKENDMLKEMLREIGLEPKDTLYYNSIDNTIYSEKGRSTIKNLSKNIDIYSNNDDIEEYTNTQEYLEFINYYAKSKIMNLNIVEDINLIKDTLKVGYQHNKQEIFGIIAYDKNNEIIKTHELSKGGINASVVDPRTLLRELIMIENMKGVAIFHNHPSGNPKPSQEDLGVTKRLMNVLDSFNIEYLDHFIVGMEDVYSLSDNIFGFESKNFEYQDLSLTRENAGNYEKRLGDIMKIKKGDILKTGASDNTLVLKVKDDNAILFTGRQFIVAHGIQREGDKAHWNWGEYYNELPDDVFGKNRSKDELEEDVEFEDDWDMEM